MDLETLKRRVRYDAKTGKLYWREGRFPNRETFLTKQSKGYVGNGKILSHRAAFALTYGRWPSAIDHINGNKTDNRLCNLREVTPQQNSRNMRARSGAPMAGVTKYKGKWIARVAGEYAGFHACLGRALQTVAQEREVMGFDPQHGKRV